MRRRTLLGAALAAPLLARPARAPASAPPARFSFAFITDTHIQPERGAAAACHRCFAQIAREPHDFVIHGGDHVFDAMEVGRDRATHLMDLYLATERVIGHPVHHVIGNHDCFGIFANSGVDPTAPGYGKAYFTERFGPTYYSFDHKGVHFIMLDSIGLTADRSYEGRVDAAQLDWLRRDLAATAAATPIIVSTHIPLVTAFGCYEPPEWTNTPHNWTFVVNGREVLRLLAGHRIIAILQGHSHTAETVVLNGIPFITGGAVAGADWRGHFLGTAEGYLRVTVHDGHVTTRYTRYGFESIDRQDVAI